MGSNPIALANSIPARVSDDFPGPKLPYKAGDHLQEAVDAFLLSRRVANCSPRTLEIYTANLGRFAGSVGRAPLGAFTLLDVQRHLTGLREILRPVSVHQHYRTLAAFFRWCIDAGLLTESPMRGLTMRVPRTLPTVPEDEHVRRLLAACPETFEGRRARALVALLADSGLRISEALRLRIEDIRFGERTLHVRGGKGGKDGVGFFGAETAQLLRRWLSIRREAVPEDFVFTDRTGRPLGRVHACHVMHRLSAQAGLPRKVGPHALRHYAATSILKQTGDLELVRQVLRHESLIMALRYAHLTKPEVSRKFRRASPLDNLKAGR